MLTRTYRISCLHLDRFLHLVWLQLALLDLQVALGVLLVVPLVGHLQVMVLDTAMVAVVVQDLDMVLNILVVAPVIMAQTEVMEVRHHLDLVDTVAVMEAVDLVATVDHLVASILQLKTATHQAVDIHLDHRTAFLQVAPLVAILLKALQVATLHPGLVDHHIQDLGVLILDLVAHLILDLVVHHTQDLAVLLIPALEVYLVLVLLVKVVPLELLDHPRQFNQVHLPQALTQHLQHPQQMVLPHPPLLQAQLTLLRQEQTHLLLQITLPLHPPHSQDQLGLPLPTLAHLGHLLPTTLHLTLLMVGHLLAHITTHHLQASQATLDILHILHLVILVQEDLLQDTHLVVLLQDLEATEVHPQDLGVIVALLAMVVLLAMVDLLDMVVLLDMAALLGMVALLVIVVLLVMAVHQDMVLQGKGAILHMATRVDQEDTLVLLEDIHHTDHLVVPVVLEVRWALHHLEAILHMIKTAMVHPQEDLEVLVLEVLHQHLNGFF